ncbi:hypothetical protein FQR65_LT20431 [Abscondita terminalis]|nr:hypothetical protein FQR65_LT20431 [Abscondita terminalis]
MVYSIAPVGWDWGELDRIGVAWSTGWDSSPEPRWHRRAGPWATGGATLNTPLPVGMFHPGGDRPGRGRRVVAGALARLAVRNRARGGAEAPDCPGCPGPEDAGLESFGAWHRPQQPGCGRLSSCCNSASRAFWLLMVAVRNMLAVPMRGNAQWVELLLSGGQSADGLQDAVRKCFARTCSHLWPMLGGLLDIGEAAWPPPRPGFTRTAVAVGFQVLGRWSRKLWPLWRSGAVCRPGPWGGLKPSLSVVEPVEDLGIGRARKSWLAGVALGVGPPWAVVFGGRVTGNSPRVGRGQKLSGHAALLPGVPGAAAPARWALRRRGHLQGWLPLDSDCWAVTGLHVQDRGRMTAAVVCVGSGGHGAEQDGLAVGGPWA